MFERIKKFHSKIKKEGTKTLEELKSKKTFSEIESKQLEIAKKAFVAVRKFYSTFGIDTSHIPDPKIYWAHEEVKDAAYYDFTDHSIKIKKNEFSFRLVAHEFAHSLGEYKEFYGGDERVKHDVHLRVGFRQRQVGGKDFYKNVDEGMKELVARTVASVEGENSTGDSYDFEVRNLVQIMNCIDSTGPIKKAFQMFLESDANGWTKELKEKLLECFGSESLKVLNFDYFLLENMDFHNRTIYKKHLKDFFSEKTLTLTDSEKTEQGKKILDFVKRHRDYLISEGKLPN